MKALNELRKEATSSATFRGHKLTWIAPWHSERNSIQRGVCMICGMDVDINTNPLPNGIDICGEAIALTCEYAE